LFIRQTSKLALDKLASNKRTTSVYDALQVEEHTEGNFGELHLEFKIALSSNPKSRVNSLHLYLQAYYIRLGVCL